MNKLQLYITITDKNLRHVLDINADPQVKSQVADVSVALEDIDYDPKQKNIFYLLKSTDGGVFVTVLRTIPSTPVDHLAAWIYIPSDTVISSSEIDETVETVVNSVSNSKITVDTFTTLRKHFDKEYGTIDDAGATVENYGHRYAHRYYGDATGYILSDFIGTKRYQTSYLKYAGVILADKSTVKGIESPDITDEPLEQMVKILPPPIGNGTFRPMLFGKAFTHPFLAPLMGTVEVVWESNSATDFRQSIIVSRPNMRPDSIVPETPEEKEAPTAQPIVAPAITKPETQATTTPAEHSEKEKPQAAPTKEHFHEPEIDKEKASSVDKTATPAATTWSDTLSLTKDATTKAVWGAIGFLIGVLLTLLCTCSFDTDATDEDAIAEAQADSIAMAEAQRQQLAEEAERQRLAEEKEKAEKEAAAKKAEEEKKKKEAEEKAKKAVSLDAAIAYLDSYAVWDKAKLESFPDLKGLYHDMNTFNEKRLVEHWGPKLKKSAKFTKLVGHARQAIKKDKKPRVKEGQTTFNTPDKQTIKIITYLNTIDP